MISYINKKITYILIYVIFFIGEEMLIFRKSRIYIILFIIFLLMLICEIYNSIYIKKEKKENIPVVAMPINNKVIILDAGHGLPDKGAQSNSGISESSINLKIVLRLQKLLENTGSIVILTRSDENGIHDLENNNIKNKKKSEIKNRTIIGNNSNADIFISIHLNKGDDASYKGFQVFYKNNEESKNLAKSIHNSLKNNVSKENKREILSIKDKYIIDNVEIPIVIVECGFLSNSNECNLLNTEEYQNKLAWGIYIGINDYFYENK